MDIFHNTLHYERNYFLARSEHFAVQGTGYRKHKCTSLRQGRTKREQLFLPKFGRWMWAASPEFVQVPRLRLGAAQCQFARKGLCIHRLPALSNARQCFVSAVRKACECSYLFKIIIYPLAPSTAILDSSTCITYKNKPGPSQLSAHETFSSCLQTTYWLWLQTLERPAMGELLL